MMPFLIRSLGDHWYGLWILVASTLGFYGVFDMGLASATQRYISHALGSGTEQRLNSILSNSLFLYAIIASLTVLASIVIALLTPLFFESDQDIRIFQFIILVMGSTFSIHFVMNAYYGILTAYLRFDIQAMVDIIKVVLRASCIFLIFQYDASVVNLALITVLFDLISQLMILKSAQRQADWINPRIGLVNIGSIKELFSFGINSFIMFIGQQTRDRGPHFVIAGVLSIASVTIFQIATQLIQYLNQLQSSLLGVLMPSFTTLFSEGKEEELSQHYLFSLKLSALTASCLSGGIIILGNSFINFWIGPGYGDAYFAVSAMAIGYFFVLLHYPSFQLLVALAEHKVFARFEVIEGLALVIAALVSATFYGISGVALSIGIILALSRFIFMPILVSKAWKIKASKLHKEIIKLILISTLIQSIIYTLFKTSLSETSFLEKIPYAIATYLIAAMIFVLVSTNSTEKFWIKNMLLSAARRLQGTHQP